MTNAMLKQLKNDITKFDNTHIVKLSAYGSWTETMHQFDDDSTNVLKAALAAQRPLLLRGDPGTGKSQLARAAAEVLGRLFVYEVVNAHTESQDLLWKFDAVGRLAEAQTIQAGTPEIERQRILDSKRYVSPGVLWWALCWQTASDTYQNSRYQLACPEKPINWQQSQGSVILIDEIDKANAELPNGLLEILANNAIEIPWLRTTIGGKSAMPPLVIITTNEERELPPAFVRRCLVLNMDLPNDDRVLEALLVARGKLHFGEQCEENILHLAAQQLITDRQAAKDKGVVPPGQAEYLDMLRALSLLGKDEKEQEVMLRKIQKFVLRKYPVLHER